eukprot:11038134-Alexandrium_andersonii.AAC.1
MVPWDTAPCPPMTQSAPTLRSPCFSGRDPPPSQARCTKGGLPARGSLNRWMGWRLGRRKGRVLRHCNRPGLPPRKRDWAQC